MSKSPALVTGDVKRGYRNNPEDKARVEAARAAGKPYKLADMKALYLLVGANGSKTWKWGYRFNGVQKVLTIGEYPDVDLAKARAECAQAAVDLKAGIDPAAAKKTQKEETKKEAATTFGGVAAEWIALNVPDENDPNDKQPGKWSRYYAQQVRNFMGRYVINAPIGLRPIKSITSADIVALVQSIGNREKADKKAGERKSGGSWTIATLIKQWCAKVFAWAIITQRYPAGSNPAMGYTVRDAGVAKPKTRSNKALDENGLRTLFASLQAYTRGKEDQKHTGQRSTTIAIELLMITCVRTGELRKAEWPEFDLDKALWTIPAERMKMGKAHVVPLPAQAVKLLMELKAINAPVSSAATRQFLFPNRRRGSDDCMSATTLNRALGNMGFNGDNWFRMHGSRGTADTTLREQDAQHHHVEAALSHAIKGVEAHYNKAQYLAQRRAMLQGYADYLDTLRPADTPVAA